MALIDDLVAQGFITPEEVAAAGRLEPFDAIRQRMRLVQVGLERRRQYARERLRRLSEGS